MMFGLNLVEIAFLLFTILIIAPTVLHVWLSTYYTARNKGKMELLKQLKECKQPRN